MKSGPDPGSIGTQPLACPFCGGQRIARGLKVNQNAEVGRIGLAYRTAAIFTGTEDLLVDLCESCGTVLRLFVEQPQRNWITSRRVAPQRPSHDP